MYWRVLLLFNNYFLVFIVKVSLLYIYKLHLICLFLAVYFMQAVNHICLCLSCLSFAIYEYKKIWNKELEQPIDSNVIASVCMRTGRLEVNQLVKYMFDSQRCAALIEKRLLKSTPGWTQAPNPPNNSMHLDARTTRWHYSIRSLLRTEEFMKIKHTRTLSDAGIYSQTLSNTLLLEFVSCI